MKNKAEQLSVSLGNLAKNNGMEGLQLDAFIMTAELLILQSFRDVAIKGMEHGLCLTDEDVTGKTFPELFNKYWKSVTDN